MNFVKNRRSAIGAILFLLHACGLLEQSAAPVAVAPAPEIVVPTAVQVLPTVARVRPTDTVEPLVTTAPAVIATEMPVPIVPVPAPWTMKPQSDELVSLSYKWFYRTEWTWETQIPRSLYDYYKQLPRLRTTNYSVYVSHPLGDEYIALLADEIKEAAAKAAYTDYETVEFATAFVQSLPFTDDSVTTPYDEYPRYPVETLVDNGGDCEDTSILLAAIVDKLGYGAVLIMLPQHVAVGVAGEDTIEGTYYKYDGRSFYYVETTGEGYRIGESPEEYSGARASVYPVQPVAILTHDYDATPNGDQVGVQVTVHNVGTARSGRVAVLAGFASSEWVFNAQESGIVPIEAGASATVSVNVKIPQERHIRLLVQVLVDDVVVDESTSGWLDGE